MQSLRNVQALLIICVLLVAAVLSGMAMGSAASQQMAEKRRISLQFRENMQQCEQLEGAAAQACQRLAHGWAEVAKSELDSRRKGQRAVRHAAAGHATTPQKTVVSRCNALPGQGRVRCAG